MIEQEVGNIYTYNCPQCGGVYQEQLPQVKDEAEWRVMDVWETCSSCLEEDEGAYGFGDMFDE